MGFGTLSAYSRNRIPSPPQNMTTFICVTPSLIERPANHRISRHHPYRNFTFRRIQREHCASLSRGQWSSSGASLMNLHLRNRHNKFPAPLANKRILLDDFVFQIPWEDEQKVRLRLPDPLRRKNRHVRPRQESAVFVRIAIDGVIEEIRSNRAVIQKCVSLPRRSVPRDLFPFAFRGD